MTHGPKCRSLAWIFLALAGSSAGCAWVDSDYRRVLNLCDDHLAPQSTAGQIAAIPIGLPIGATAFALDLAVVHPAYSIDDAWYDTENILWSSWETDSPLRRAVWAPVGAVLTPVTWAGTWVARILLPIGPTTPASTPSQDDPEGDSQEVGQ